MSSVSGLSKAHRARARSLARQAAMLGYRKASHINYTQQAIRWEGIDKKRVAVQGEYPRNADCSSFATWCLWNGLYVPYGCRDTVNAAAWKGGYTGTMLKHGKEVVHLENVLIADCVLYGKKGSSGAHTAIVVGRRERDGKVMVVSHGSQGGPYYVPFDYRADVMCIRRFI